MAHAAAHVVEVSDGLVGGGQTKQENMEGVVGSEMDMAGIVESCSGHCSASSGAGAHTEAAADAHWDL